jgi:hypothetical protein
VANWASILLNQDAFAEVQAICTHCCTKINQDRSHDRNQSLTWAFTFGAGEGAKGIEPPLSAWEVSVTIRRLPADTLACGILTRLTASDRESLSGLIPSGT